MKRLLFFIGLATICFSSALAMGADKVVVIPLLGGKQPTGDATANDVVAGKTFSNSSGIGLTGNRPPAPVGTDYIDTQYTIQPPSPRFYNIYQGEQVGYGLLDYMTGLIWQKDINPVEQSIYEAISYCGVLVTSYTSNDPRPIEIIVMDWRLPTITEILSLIDYTHRTPALPVPLYNGSIRGLVSDGFYWSNTYNDYECSGEAPGDAYVLGMYHGSTAVAPVCPEVVIDDYRAYTLCVRGPYPIP